MKIRVLRRIGLAIAFGLAVACASPTLPLPPPATPDITASTDPAKVHLASNRGAQANAFIIVINMNASLTPQQRVTGTQADAFGSWSLDVWATRGDVLEISQEDARGERSSQIDIAVP